MLQTCIPSGYPKIQSLAEHPGMVVGTEVQGPLGLCPCVPASDGSSGVRSTEEVKHPPGSAGRNPPFIPLFLLQTHRSPLWHGTNVATRHTSPFSWGQNSRGPGWALAVSSNSRELPDRVSSIIRSWNRGEFGMGGTFKAHPVLRGAGLLGVNISRDM